MFIIFPPIVHFLKWTYKFWDTLEKKLSDSRHFKLDTSHVIRHFRLLDSPILAPFLLQFNCPYCSYIWSRNFTFFATKNMTKIGGSSNLKCRMRLVSSLKCRESDIFFHKCCKICMFILKKPSDAYKIVQVLKFKLKRLKPQLYLNVVDL